MYYLYNQSLNYKRILFQWIPQNITGWWRRRIELRNSRYRKINLFIHVAQIYAKFNHRSQFLGWLGTFFFFFFSNHWWQDLEWWTRCQRCQQVRGYAVLRYDEKRERVKQQKCMYFKKTWLLFFPRQLGRMILEAAMRNKTETNHIYRFWGTWGTRE